MNTGASEKSLDKTGHGYLENLHWLHGLLNNWFSFLGLVIALFLLVTGHPIGWVEIGLFGVLWVLTQLSVTVGMHRYFSHRSFKTKKPIRIFFAVFGSMAALGHPIFWAAIHRRHHRYSDKPGDPHSPYFLGERPLSRRQGLWHSHLGWSMNYELPDFDRYAPDLVRDPLISKLSDWYFFWVFLGLFIPTMLGGMVGESWMGAFYGFVWGGMLRIWVTHQCILSITSVSHIFGQRKFNTGDRSTNNFWLAIPTFGDAWHNNHHAFPGAAIVGWEWWQIDISGWFIKALEKMGLAWDVKPPPTTAMQAGKLA